VLLPVEVAADGPEEIIEISDRVSRFTFYGSEAESRTAIAHRDVYGALVLDSPTDFNVLYATAASPAVAALVQTIGQQVADATHRSAHTSHVRAFPVRDPKGTGLAAGAAGPRCRDQLPDPSGRRRMFTRREMAQADISRLATRTLSGLRADGTDSEDSR
jgi:hypothetical protein